MRFEEEPNRPYLGEYPFKRPYPYPYGSDLHNLWCWAESIRFRRERDSTPYHEEETILRPWQSVEHALLHYSLDYPPFVGELRGKVSVAEKAYGELLAKPSDDASYQFDQRLGELSARILRVTELIAEREAAKVDAAKSDSADSKADSTKKLPKSDRVWKAINAIKNHYKQVAKGQANQIPENAVLSMHLDKPVESKEVKNLARQLRNYRHLISQSADS